MKQSKRPMLNTLLFALLAGVLGAGAANAADASTSMGTGAVPYVSGGVGEDDPVLATKRDYNLYLVFAGKGEGEYLADVKVAIQDAKGNPVVEAESPGPMFFAKVPPGKYKVTATYNGKPVTQTAQVQARGNKDVHFYW